MRACVVVMMLVCLAMAGLANDGFMVGVGGSWRMMRSEHESIRMVREWVHMDIYPGYYDVKATFRFRNDGDAVTVTMGFPETGGGVDTDGSKTYFTNFTTTVDTKPVRVKRVLSDKHDQSYKAFWIKRVSFDEGQERMVHVEYRTRSGEDSTVGPYGAAYVFSGGNWKGKVERSEMTVDFHLPGVSVISTDGVPMEQQGNRLKHLWTNWEAESGFNVTYFATFPGWLILKESPPDYLLRPVYQVTGPGQAHRIQWCPPAIMRKGRPFIALREFARAIDHRMGRRKSAVVTWDQAKNEYVIKVGKRTVRFHRGAATMRIEGGKTIKLPTAPFIQPQPYGDTFVFVPLAPLVQAFDGRAVVDEEKHQVSFSLPIFKKK